jgi:hypothetical protein
MRSIRERVDAVRSRQQRQWLWTCLSWGLVMGGAAGAAGGLFALFSGEAAPWAWIVAGLCAGPLLGGLYSALRPRALRDAAVAIDRACRLKDRVVTALNLMAKPPRETPVQTLQLADAELHLASIDPVSVAPIHAPRPWYWGLGLGAAALLIGYLASPPEQLAASVVSNEVVVSQAHRVEKSLEELKQFNEQQVDPELEKLLRELGQKIEELKQPGLDPKEALAKLSEMEAVLQTQQEQANDPSSAAALKSVGEALSLSEPLKSAGQAMADGEMEKAAEELAKLELPRLDRQTERAISEKLAQATRDSAAGQQKQGLQEALGDLSQGVSQGNRAKFREGAQGLAGECQKQGRRKMLSDLLRKQCQCLSECKGECESECESTGESKQKGGKKWGLAASGNEPGEPTSKLGTKPPMNLTGQQSADGDVDVETTDAPEQEQAAVREYRAQAEKYEQLSESVLSSEPIPLGHRQTIRRYFEMIRPQGGETDAVNAAVSEPK